LRSLGRERLPGDRRGRDRGPSQGRACLQIGEAPPHQAAPSVCTALYFSATFTIVNRSQYCCFGNCCRSLRASRLPTFHAAILERLSRPLEGYSSWHHDRIKAVTTDRFFGSEDRISPLRDWNRLGMARVNQPFPPRAVSRERAGVFLFGRGC
jgi:hypothetical protein